MPYFRGSVPPVQRLAIENLSESFVIVEVDGVRLSEAAAGMMRWSLLGGELVSRRWIDQ